MIQNKWIIEKHDGCKIYYTITDKENSKEYLKLIRNGVGSVKTFFSGMFSSEFGVFIHPDRHSLDSTWRKDWNMPAFKSECWMVASGTATRLDMISPKRWTKEACEHDYKDQIKTQALITHELVHVYHGQANASPDFSNVTGIDWFVEGLATFASGQLDWGRIAEIKKAITDNRIPAGLDKFWTGNLRYGLSGSVVMYIDKQYGRVKLKELLKFNKNSDILSALNTTEEELLRNWKKYFNSL